jgi:RNA polymerase sigma-70 factor, ECF subfamily
VFRFGLRFVWNDEVAEDLISEVFLDVWRQASKFEAAVLAIPRFKALSALRRGKDLELDQEAPGDKSAEEVAEIVGIPENTVKTHLFYVREKIAELLKAAGVERGWP